MAGFEIFPTALVAVARLGALLVVLHGGVTESNEPLFVAYLGADNELLATLDIPHWAVRDQTADFVTLSVH